MELSAPGSLAASRMDELHAELVKLESPVASESIQQVARHQLFLAYAPVKDISISLLAELVRVLERKKAEAIDAEKAFFQIHGVPHEQTGVSRRYDAMIKNLRTQLENLTNTPPHVTRDTALAPSQTVITGIFGLEIIPGVL